MDWNLNHFINIVVLVNTHIYVDFFFLKGVVLATLKLNLKLTCIFIL